MMMDLNRRSRPLFIVADGYGLSASVDEAIRTLLREGKLAGTSCMTMFSDWRDEANLLLPVIAETGAALGLHLTLTRYKPLSGVHSMCSLRRRVTQSLLGGVDKGKLQRELDAQLNAFIDVVGRVPDYIDSHDHVHYLPVVREWLIARRDLLISPRGHGPWLRGEPDMRLAPSFSQRSKVAFVKQMAKRFDGEMRRAGYAVRGPLTGFYARHKPQAFAQALRFFRHHAPDDAIIMCRPGHIGDLQGARDRFASAREAEFLELMRQ